MITDSGAAEPAIPVIPDPLDPNVNRKPNPENLSPQGEAKATSKPANEVITDSTVIRGRNARAICQEWVSEYGFASSYQSVQGFVRKRRGIQTPEARVVIVTAACGGQAGSSPGLQPGS